MLGFERAIWISRRPRGIKWCRGRRQWWTICGSSWTISFINSVNKTKFLCFTPPSASAVTHVSFLFEKLTSLLKNFYYTVTIIITTLPIWSCLEPCTCVTWLDLSKMTGSIWPAVLPAMGRFSFALSTLSPLKTENKRLTLSSYNCCPNNT